MRTEMDFQIGFCRANLVRLNNWNDEIEDRYARDSGECERMTYETLAIIDELEQAIAIERIVQLCLTGR